MTAPTTTRRTRKATTADTADTTAPVTDQATEATPAPDAAPTGDQAANTAPAYTIPDWSAGADQAAYVAAVGTAYRDADKGTKAAMRSAWARFQSDALNALGTDADAVGKLTLVRDINAVLVTSRPVVETDPADAFVIHLNALEAARTMATAAFREAHGDDAYRAMMDRANGNLTGDEATAVQALATKLATVRTANRRTGPQRSVQAHIESALDAVPAGTILTCAQIHNHRSDAYGPDESPSVGAIGAAHGRDMDGIESTENASKVKGFRKA